MEYINKMEKLENMRKQLLFLHAELRKVKCFHKASAKNFQQFYNEMTTTLKTLKNGNIFNEIHYLNMLNINMIDFFNSQIYRQSQLQSSIHSRLKEEGNKLKIFERELDKRLKTLRAAIKQRENRKGENTFSISTLKKDEPHILNLNLEIESTLKELAGQFTQIRESIKISFDDYLDTLCSFAETRHRLKFLHQKSDENFKECSPLMDKKYELLMNLDRNPIESHVFNDQNREFSGYPSKVKSPLKRVYAYSEENIENVQDGLPNEFEQVPPDRYFKENFITSKSDNKRSHETDANSSSFFTPLKGRKFTQITSSEYKLPFPKSPISIQDDKFLKEHRMQMVDSYLTNKRQKSKSIHQLQFDDLGVN